MQGTRRCIPRPRLKTLLVLIVVLNIGIFIIFNFRMIPDKSSDIGK